mgnify:CR=1 FL=1
MENNLEFIDGQIVKKNLNKLKKIIDTFRLIAYNISIKIKCEV